MGSAGLGDRDNRPPADSGCDLAAGEGSCDVYSVGEGTYEFSSAPVDFTSLKTLVGMFSTDPTVTTGLNDKLDAAAAARNPQTRANIIDSFISQVNAQIGKALTQEQAQLLITLSNALR